jgi:hypothetical protein
MALEDDFATARGRFLWEMHRPFLLRKSELSPRFLCLKISWIHWHTWSSAFKPPDLQVFGMLSIPTFRIVIWILAFMKRGRWEAGLAWAVAFTGHLLAKSSEVDMENDVNWWKSLEQWWNTIRFETSCRWCHPNHTKFYLSYWIYFPWDLVNSLVIL